LRVQSFDPYRPCPCGSGKKYKFCCLQKQRERASRSDNLIFPVLPAKPETGLDLGAPVLVGDLDESRRLCDQGLQLMAKGEYGKAIPVLRKAAAEAPFVYTSANNLALCLFVTGKLEEAICAQRDSIEAGPLPNPFGLANLATFQLVNGNEAEGEQALDQVMDMELPSADACIKVCETLARFKRHQAILDTADKSGYGHDPVVCFFTGIAAANLGLRERAQQDLKQVQPGHHKADMVQRYLRHLREGSSPHTARGDWPYLISLEVCPVEIIAGNIKSNSTDWMTRRIAAYCFEAMLNETADKPDDAIALLSQVTHPEGTALLWMLVKGTFGPDSLRMAALRALQERGAVKPGQQIEMHLNGARSKVATVGTRLDSEYRFGGTLPSALDKLYAKTVKAGYGKHPDWDAIGGNYQRIMNEAPDYFPARYNFAVSLLHRGRTDEAERILRELVAPHPEYLFAPATLLQILVNKGQTQEADALVQSAATPAETHPEAMVAWMVAQTLYHVAAGRDKEACHCIEMARKISPENQAVKRLWQDYKN
jgi:tetratricopeptide (TPR) repeat protein